MSCSYRVINDMLSRVLKHGLISARILLTLFLQQVRYVHKTSVGYQIQFQDLFLRLLFVCSHHRVYIQSEHHLKFNTLQ